MAKQEGSGVPTGQGRKRQSSGDAKTAGPAQSKTSACASYGASVRIHVHCSTISLSAASKKTN